MVRLNAVLGAGGTGKSFMINEEIKKDNFYGYRTATTGIAAVNMGTIAGAQDPTTINSALRYFKPESLLRNMAVYLDGQESLVKPVYSLAGLKNH